MHLSGPAAAAFRLHLAQFRARHPHRLGAFSHGPKVDLKRTRAVECSERTDAIPSPRKQDTELRLGHQTVAALQLGWGDEFHS